LRKLLALVIVLITVLNLFVTPKAFAGLSPVPVYEVAVSLPRTYVLAKTDSNSKSSKRSSHSSHKKSSSHSQKRSGNCDYPDQVDSAGRRCGNRAASIRAGGRLGGSL
jgi:hypothetical protein